MKLVSLVLLFSFLRQPMASAQIQETRRVLVLTELGLGSPGFTALRLAIVNSLNDARYHTEIYSENLETTLFPDEATQRQFRETYALKYRDRKPDVIVALGPTPLRWMVEPGGTFFPETPVVFWGLEGLAAHPQLGTRFTGVWSGYQPVRTLELALRLQPRTEHVVVTGGVGSFDRLTEAFVKERFRTAESKLDFTYLTDLTMADLLERLRRLPPNTVVVHTSLMEDAAGRHFIDATQAIPQLARAANAPVYVLDDVDLGTGALGGYLVTYVAQGRELGGMVIRILGGQKPQDIPILTDTHSALYMLDWRALHRWGLKESDLPPGSVVLNREPSFWELYQRYVIAGISLGLLQMLIIVGLLRQRAERRKAQTELVLSHEQLLESEQRFRLVANKAPVLIWRSGPERLCTYFNEPWLQFTGRSLDAELGDGWTEGMHPEDKLAFMESYNAAFDLRLPFSIEYRLRRHDGEYRWVLGTGVPMLHADGSFVGYIGSAVDVTERKIAEEALSTIGQRLIEAQEEERSWIARELHDDINQRLGVLAWDLDEMQQQRLLAVAPEIREGMGEACKQIRHLIRDIQTLSRRLHVSILDMLGLETAAVTLCRELSDRHNVEITFDSERIQEALPKDISLCLFRVLQESLQNAIKHSGSRQIQVSLRGESNEIQLSVHDSGIGFEPKEATKGRGLGFTSMRERLKLVSGQLSIDSKPGVGTTIHARVPRQ